MCVYLCEASHAVGTRAVLCEALSQQTSGQTIVRHGQRRVVSLQQVPRAAALSVMQTEGERTISPVYSSPHMHRWSSE